MKPLDRLRERAERDIRRLKVKIRVRERLLAYLDELASEDAPSIESTASPSESKAAPPESDGPASHGSKANGARPGETWADAIHRVLATAGKAMTLDEVRAVLNEEGRHVPPGAYGANLLRNAIFRNTKHGFVKTGTRGMRALWTARGRKEEPPKKDEK